MAKQNPTCITAFGLKVLLGNHEALRQLKRRARPLEHGHKVWTSSWLLIDYLQTEVMTPGRRLLDLGCGWGLAGIFGAKILKADVVWADIDGAVLPYLDLMAQTNSVPVNFLELGIDQVGRHLLRQVDMIVASDICFCDTMIDPMRRMIDRAEAAGTVRQILIADPGRWPFEDFCGLMEKKKDVTLIEHQIESPRTTSGKILKIEL